jgi:hypothetical protein
MLAWNGFTAPLAAPMETTVLPLGQQRMAR